MNITAFGIAVVTLCASLAFIPASASDFTLQIFGNANMDDTIDELDIEYVQGIIDGTKDETDLADANYDGTVDEKDIAQIEQIMRGEEETLTLIDDIGDAVTIQKPIESIVLIEGYAALYETWRVLGIKDQVVGINDRYVKPGGIRYSERYYPELIMKHNVGSTKEPDLEVIASLAPDLIYIDHPMEGLKDIIAQAFPNIPLICMDITYEDFTRNTRTTGYIFDKREESERYINWRNGWKNIIEEPTAEISDENRPLVFLSSNYEPGLNEFPSRGGPRHDPLITGAGGKNIWEGMTGMPTANMVDPEWLLEENPYIIIFTSSLSYSGFEFNSDDTIKLAALYEDFMSRPEFAELDAVKNKRVYFINLPHLLFGGASGIIAEAYFAKWIQPDLSVDINPTKIHQEFLELQGVDLDLGEYGVFVYPLV